MKVKPLFTAIYLLAATSLLSQSVVYENSNNNLLSLNPSFAGSNGDQRLQLTSRHQWPNLSHNFVTHNIAYDTYLKSSNSGIGLTFQNDDFAHRALLDRRIGVSYSKYFTSKRTGVLIVPSFDVQFIDRSLDVSRLRFGDLIDGRIGTAYNNRFPLPSSRKMALAYSAGILIQKNNFIAGFSIRNLNNPDVGMFGSARLSTLYNFHFSYTKVLGRNSSLQLFGAQTKQGGFIDRQMRLCAYLNNFLEIGTAFHNYDFYDLIVGFRNSTLAINFTYSARYGVVRAESYDVFNIGLSYSFGNKNKSNSSLNLETW